MAMRSSLEFDGTLVMVTMPLRKEVPESADLALIDWDKRKTIGLTKREAEVMVESR